MPIYEYECRTCGNHFERLQRFKDEPETECPQCHHEVHRLLGTPAIIFHGPGFYVTDNGKNGNGSCKEKKEKAPAGAACKACA